jgi:hypothetical protein
MSARTTRGELEILKKGDDERKEKKFEFRRVEANRKIVTKLTF